MGKPIALLIPAIFFINLCAFAQKKFELAASIGSGLSYFTGPGATGSSTYYLSGLAFPYDSIGNKMAQPYGRRPITNFIAGVQADLKLSKWILALSVEYEHSGGAMHCDSVISPSGSIQTTGKYIRQYDFVSINPHAGRIIVDKAVIVSVFAGIDYTSKLALSNQFEYIDQNGMKNSFGYSGDEPEVNDFRLTFGASLTRKKWTLVANYKIGLTNYNKSGDGAVYSRLLHFQIQYCFLQKQFKGH